MSTHSPTGQSNGGPSRSGHLNRTPLADVHDAAGARMADFAGWAMPIEYGSGIVAEHVAVRQSCGLFDVSHMGSVRLGAPGVGSRVNSLLTNDLAGLDPGQVQYTLLCTNDGGVVDDMLVTVLDRDDLLVVPNAANTAAVVEALGSVVPSDGLVDVSAGTAMIAVQGPASPRTIRVVGLPWQMDYMTVRRSAWRGTDVIVSRSGYTGEVGYEVIVPSDAAQELWAALLAVPGVVPCGLGARDTLRLEMGYPLHGQDIGPAVSPVQAGLGFAVGWDKPEFGGRAALHRERAQGPRRRLRGVQLRDRGVPRSGMEVLVDGAAVGSITSGTFSPTLRQGIGLALVAAEVGVRTPVVVRGRARELAAHTVRPPFVDSSPRGALTGQ